ncbi:hypothetical protein [Formosa maritima]|uniref:Uncharacterized protein n=1 Tax=Formosa maritima TaxID=2592046 RepID=A0A5D0GML3_9FLAO|nr:hypothetical protein [Formosa maritima]TYA58947.1 hypothetical protein FVF61_02015 [Formosa maritima]
MKTHQKLKEELIQFQQTDKKSLIIGSLVATLLAITPYLFYLYESVPSTQVWDTFLFTFNAGILEDSNYVMWMLTGKAIPLMFLIIWFFTCRHWWYHVILVPMVMYLFQIVSIFYSTSNIDEFQLMYMVPIMAIVVPTIYLIRAKMFDKINTASKSMEELEEEFKMKPGNIWEKIKQYF